MCHGACDAARQSFFRYNSAQQKALEAFRPHAMSQERFSSLQEPVRGGMPVKSGMHVESDAIELLIYIHQIGTYLHLTSSE